MSPLGPIQRYQALCAKQGLLAIKQGMRLNTSYTPRNCMAVASKLTGRKFKPRDYDGAIAALEEVIA